MNGEMEENGERWRKQEQIGSKTREEEALPTLRIGPYKLKWEISEPGEYFLEKARRELRETPEVKAAAFKEVRLLLQEEAALSLPDDDSFYQRFLRPCKWYGKSAAQLIKRLYRFYANHPRISANLYPSAEKAGFVSGVMIPLPLRSQTGCRILLIQGGSKWKPKEVNLNSLFRALMILLRVSVMEEQTQIAGAHVIIDVAGFSLSHLAALSPSMASTISEWVQQCVPCRLKAIHIVNQPFIFNMAFAIFKPFILEKTRRRILFHGSDRTDLIKRLGVDALPEYLGGKTKLPEEDFGSKLWEYACRFEHFYREEEKYGYAKRTT